MNSVSTICEICRKPGSGTGYRYARLGTHRAEEPSEEMKRCWSCKRRGCERCLVLVEETADDYFIDIYSCASCLEKLNQ